jgi:siroheme synthase-like protein
MSAPLLPVFVKLEGRSCLVAGAGAVGLQKVRSLLECGAHVTVVAPDARGEIQDLARQGRIAWRPRRYAVEDIVGQQMVIAATSDPEVNHVIYSDALSAGVLANAVDDPPFCDFYFGSVVRRGPLQIGISTAGESPALAQRLRRQLESLLDKSTGSWLERLGALRREVLATHPAGEERNSLLHKLAERDLCDSAQCPSRAMAMEAPRRESASWWLT